MGILHRTARDRRGPSAITGSSSRQTGGVEGRGGAGVRESFASRLLLGEREEREEGEPPGSGLVVWSAADFRSARSSTRSQRALLLQK